MCMCVDTHVPQDACRGQRQLVKVGSFFPVASEDQSLVVRIGGKPLYQLSHLPVPLIV